MSLSQEFENAKSNLELLKNDPGNDAKLKLYALYKQASCGNCNTTKPGFADVVNKYKWNAWNNLKNMSKVNYYCCCYFYFNRLKIRENFRIFYL